MRQGFVCWSPITSSVPIRQEAVVFAGSQNRCTTFCIGGVDSLKEVDCWDCIFGISLLFWLPPASNQNKTNFPFPRCSAMSFLPCLTDTSKYCDPKQMLLQLNCFPEAFGHSDYWLKAWPTQQTILRWLTPGKNACSVNTWVRIPSTHSISQRREEVMPVTPMQRRSEGGWILGAHQPANPAQRASSKF